MSLLTTVCNCKPLGSFGSLVRAAWQEGRERVRRIQPEGLHVPTNVDDRLPSH